LIFLCKPYLQIALWSEDLRRVAKYMIGHGIAITFFQNVRIEKEKNWLPWEK